MKSKNKDGLKIAKLISDYLYSYAPSFLTNSNCTLKSYKDTLRLYLSFLEGEGITPETLSKEHFGKEYIEKWIYWMKYSRNCSPETCNVRLGALRTFIKFLSSRDVEFLYLAQESSIIKRQKCAAKKFSGMSRNAVTSILAAPDTTTRTGIRDLAFLALLYSTAARLDEIRSIKIAHLHINDSRPYIVLFGKGGKMRTAYILPRIVTYINAYIKDFHDDSLDPEAFLFYSRVGGKYAKLSETALDKRIKKYAEIARKHCDEIPPNVHAHQFRHAKASHWLEDGVSIVQISFLLGHAQLETTMKYLDITTDQKVAALATVDDENTKTLPKRWKRKDGSLKEFCGLNL